MADKFLSTGGSGVTDLGNGSATIFASTLGAKNLDPSRPVKTNAVSQLVSDNLEISDINNLQSELDAGISNPLTGSLNFSNFSSVNKTSDEFIKKSTGSTGNATAGSIKIYANTDGQLHSVDESGTDKIIGNSGHVLGPNSVSADGKVAIYNGTTGKVLKDSNLLIDAQNHLDISGNFARYQGGVDYLNPTAVNSLAAVGYVQQERDSSNGRITTLEQKTSTLSVNGSITTLTADTINMDTSTGTKLSVGEFKTIIREQLDIARQNTPVMKIIHEGSTSISDTAGYILCEGGVGSGGESWFLGTFGAGSNLLKLESKAPNTNIELITADVNRVRLKADGAFEILDGNLVLSEQLEQRTNGVALQDFDNIKSGGVLDSEQVSKRKIGAYDNTNTIAPLVNEIVTANGDITATNHASDYEIKTSRTGSVVKDTRLKIGANGVTEIAGPSITLDGDVRVGSAGFLELNFGTLSDSYRFPSNRPAAGQVLTGGLGDGALAWEQTGYSRVNSADITTSSATYVTMTNMSLTPGAGKYLVLFSGNFTHDGGKNDAYANFSIFNNGAEVGYSHRYAWLETDPVFTPLSTQAFVTLADGETVDVRWRDVEGEDPRCVEKSLLLVRIS